MGFFSKTKQPIRRIKPRAISPSIESPLMVMPYDDLVKRALNEAELILSTMNGVINFVEADWSVNQTSGTIEFTNSKMGTKAVGKVQVVGSYLQENRSWLWAWGNPSIEGKLKRNSLLVKKYGERHGIKHLLSPSISCDPDAAWELGAIACVLAGDQGVYRGDADGTKMIMNFCK